MQPTQSPTPASSNPLTRYKAAGQAVRGQISCSYLIKSDNHSCPGCQTMYQSCWSKSLHAMGESDRKPLAKLLLRTLPFGISICLFKFYFTNHSPNQTYLPSNQNNIYNLVRSAHSETSILHLSFIHIHPTD